MRTKLHSIPLKTMDSGALALAILEHAGSSCPDAVPVITDALHTAVFLHRGQTRANRAGLPRTPYSEHPLRNALRALRMGVTDPDIITATLLHDTMEDCAPGIITTYLHRDPDTMDGELQRALAFDWIQDTFGHNTARLVEAVSNPLPTGSRPSREVSNARYAAHVHDAIHEDPDVFVVKFTDFVDNAVGLHHNVEGLGAGKNNAMAARLAVKYLPLVHIFEAEFAASYGDIMTRLSPAGMDAVSAHLTSARTILPSLAEPAAA